MPDQPDQPPPQTQRVTAPRRRSLHETNPAIFEHQAEQQRILRDQRLQAELDALRPRLEFESPPSSSSAESSSEPPTAPTSSELPSDSSTPPAPTS